MSRGDALGECTAAKHELFKDFLTVLDDDSFGVGVYFDTLQIECAAICGR